MLGWLRVLWKQPDPLKTWLRAALGHDLGGFHVYAKELPQYRFIDVFRVAEARARAAGVTGTLESDHRAEYLTAILHGEASKWQPRRLNRADRIAWPTGPEEEAFFPVDVFWVCAGTGRPPLLVRVHYDVQRESVFIEVAGQPATVDEAFITEAMKQADAGSAYRNRMLALRFEAATRDRYGDIEKPERLRVIFAPEPKLDDADVVMEEDVRRLLWRNIIDLHVRRDVLKAHGVPIRRGILLHGPPGTGKTFATRYLCAKLPQTTRIVVAGSALQQVPAIFALARLLQPALVILEDVDLVFTARDINYHGGILAELLDQMDGLRPHEDVGFVLTTNAIDRIEAAIKDRPGRISQCIHLGPPNLDLRRRYLAHYLAPYATAGVDLDGLAARSAGATQAFLKDWVHRAAQIATERLVTVADKLELRTQDFEIALREAKSSGQGTSARIIGFLADAT